MHPENKLTTHAKKVVSSSENKIPEANQQQGLGTKGVGIGSHGIKANQISPGLNSVGSSGVGGGITMLKTKSKRERAISMDTGDLRDSLEPDAKDAVLRGKRRCVLEKKQPYSGDEWCSGADTEEDEDKPNIAVHQRMITGTSAGVGGQSSAPPPGYVFGSGGLRTDVPRPAQQVVYVFTTSLANSAAEAVINGHTDSILMFHQQHVPRTKLDQCVPVVRKLPSLPEQLSSRSTPPMGTPKSQNDTPRPASVGGAVGAQVMGGSSSSGQPQETNLPVHQPLDDHSSNSSHKPLQGNAGPSAGALTRPVGVEGVGSMAHPTAGVSPTSSVSMLPAHLQDDGPQRGPCTMDGLSKEQIEHRERSLQTLRDIERLLLRSGVSGGTGDLEGPNGNAGAINSNSMNRNNNNTDNSGRNQEGTEATKNAEKFNNNVLPLGLPQVKKHEEPLQSMMSQTQNLGGSRLDDPIGPNMNLPTHLHHHLSSPPELDLGPLQNTDGLTQEQMAWRRLQEEYYQEKRRQQEMHPHSHPQHYRMMAEMGMSRGPHLMVRGPPPPYHSKADEQWGPAPLMGGSMGSNPRLMDIHQDGSQGPRFVGQMPRGPSGARGYPGSPGRVLAMEGLGLQRPGMGWVEDLPINMAGGRSLLHGCYPGDGPGGPSQPLHNDPERHLLREEVLRIMEKRQLQRLEQERFATLHQQQEGIGQLRLLDNTGRPSLPNQDVAIGPHTDPLDFPHSQAIMNSPLGKGREGDGHSLRDLGDSPLNTNLTLNVNLTPQEHHVLVQKLRGVNHVGGPVGDILSPEDISHLRTGHNGRGGASKVTGPEGPAQFLNQRFCGGQSERSYVQQSDQTNFGPDQQETTQLGSTSHPSQMSVDMGPKGSDPCPHHPSNLSVNVNSMGSPAMAHPHPLKSPSIGPEPSPLMPSPSASVLKSPTPASTTSPLHPPLPTTSRAGTPSSTSMKSPPMIGPTSLGRHSPSCSPGHQKSPVMNLASPCWTASPKTSMPSPGRPPNGKGMGNGTINSETGPTLPPKSSNSTVPSKPTSLNSNMPCTSSPDVPPSQNPLSLIMSQMSKYAMSSSAPLYHEAIKTISTSDDEMIPDRPLLPGDSVEGTHHPSSQMLLSTQSVMGPPGSPQSPIGMLLQGQQQLSHGPPGSMLSSPNLMSMSGMNSSIVGGAGGPSGGIGPCNASMHPQNQMMGFLRMQASSQGPLHSPVGPLSQQYSQHPDDMLPPQQFHLLGKGLPHQQPTHPSDSFPAMRINDGPDLSDVIRPSHTGIPEFDLSRIIPSDKPSSTLQYFPKSEGMSQPQPNSHHSQGLQQPPPTQLLKQLSSGPHHSNAPSSNPHIANLQNMMAEQQLSIHPSHYGIRTGMSQSGGRGMVVGPVGPMTHPGHMMVRTGLGSQQQQQYHHQQQQVLMSSSLQHHPSHSHPSMMSPQQQHTHNLMAQQSLMMMQAKQRGMPIPGEQLGQQGPLMSPQGLIMASSHPGMMGPQSLRQRGMSLNSPLGYAPGNVHNMPF